jgi:hypothetical protein
MISARYAIGICLVLAVALVPTLIHSYAGVVVPDGRSTASIPAVLAGYTSAPSGRDAGWGGRRFEAVDWFERRYLSGSDEVLMTVIRSYDLKRLYHHPELDVAYGTGFLEREVRRFPGHDTVPVNVLYQKVDRGSVAMYVLHYDEGYVEDPLMFQIRSATELLFSGRKPMTLIFARDVSVPIDANPETLPSARLLLAAVDAFAGTPSK